MMLKQVHRINEMKKLRVAVIGTGGIAKLNIAALLALPEIEIAAAVNHHPEKAEKLLAELGIACPVYADWKEMLREMGKAEDDPISAERRLDAAAIFLPHDLHLPAFRDCAEAGLDIMIEKPLGRTEEECEEILRLEAQCGIKATVCHTQRYNAIYIAACAYIKGHPELGKLCSVTDRIDCDYYWDGRPAWQLSKERSGDGPLLNYGVHQLDRVHYLAGQVMPIGEVSKAGKESPAAEDIQEEITVRTERTIPGIETCSAFAMQGELPGHVLYSITFSGTSGPFINETALHFEHGSVLCNLTDNGALKSGLYVYEKNGSENGFREEPVPLPNAAHDMYVREFRAAADYLLGKTGCAPVPLSWAAGMVRLALQ